MRRGKQYGRAVRPFRRCHVAPFPGVTRIGQVGASGLGSMWPIGRPEPARSRYEGHGRRADDRDADAGEGSRRGVPDRHHRGQAAGDRAGPEGGGPGGGLRAPRHGHERLRRHGGFRRGGHHGGVPPSARDEPHGPAGQERRDHECRRLERRARLAGRDPDRRLEPPRRDDVPGRGAIRVSQGTRLRDGRRPGLGAPAVLHRGGAARVAERRRGDHPGLPR